MTYNIREKPFTQLDWLERPRYEIRKDRAQISMDIQFTWFDAQTDGT